MSKTRFTATSDDSAETLKDLIKRMDDTEGSGD